MTAATRKASERAPMTDAQKKQAERNRRKADGQVALSGWLTASDHAALTQMARDSGMTQAQVVSRLIHIRRALETLRQFEDRPEGMARLDGGDWIRYPDLAALMEGR